MAFCLGGDLGGYCVSFCFVCEVFDLDEFVVVEGFVDVGDEGFCEAVSSYPDSGFEAVSLFPEVAGLSGCEGVHVGGCLHRFLNWFLFEALGEGWEWSTPSPPIWSCLGWGRLGGFLGLF